MEDTRKVWGWTALDTSRADVRQGLRRIRRNPGTAALAVCSLALAFAPSVTVFSAMDRLFLTPVPVPAPREIVEIMFRDTRPNAAQPYELLSYPEFADFRRALSSFSGLTYQAGHGALVSLNGRRLIVGVSLVDGGYFRVLGVKMHSGAGFVTGTRSLVASYAFWTRELGAAPDVVGRNLTVNGMSFMIGGVADPDFRGMNAFVGPDLWIPLDSRSDSGLYERRDVREGIVWGRLRPGVTVKQAAVEVDAVCQDLARTWPATNRYLAGHTVARLADSERGGLTLTAVGIVLLGILLAVACANVTGVLLARAEERRHETAIRQALGASRARLVREWIVESLVLSCCAAVLGLAGWRALMNLLPALIPSMVVPVHFEFSSGPRVWMYAGMLVVVSALAFGVVPAWRASRPDLLAGLRRDGAVSVLRVRIPLRSLLIVMQVAAAEVLLFGAGLVLDLVSNVQRVNAGFDPTRPVVLGMLVPDVSSGSPSELDCELVRERLERIPGVRRAVYGRSFPLSGSGGPSARLEVPGQEVREVAGGSAGPGFLPTLGVRLLAGRDLRADDSRGVLVNETLARQLDPAGSAVGREIRLDGSARQIVGVFADIKWNSIYDSPRPRAISLTTARIAKDATFAAEVNGDPQTYLPAMRSQMLAAQPGSLVASVKTLRQQYRDSLFMERTATRVFYGLGLLALLLTIAGLHGVTSALFARRSREFAIRLALGAGPRHVMLLVAAGATRLTIAGLAIGLAIGLAGATVLACLSQFGRFVAGKSLRISGRG